MTLRGDAEPLLRILVHPFLIKPVPRVGVVRRNEMKLFGVDAFRMPKRDHLRGQEKIEGLNLSRIRLARIQSFKPDPASWKLHVPPHPKSRDLSAASKNTGAE